MSARAGMYRYLGKVGARRGREVEAVAAALVGCPGSEVGRVRAFGEVEALAPVGELVKSDEGVAVLGPERRGAEWAE